MFGELCAAGDITDLGEDCLLPSALGVSDASPSSGCRGCCGVVEDDGHEDAQRAHPVELVDDVDPGPPPAVAGGFLEGGDHVDVHDELALCLHDVDPPLRGLLREAVIGCACECHTDTQHYRYMKWMTSNPNTSIPLLGGVPMYMGAMDGSC
eukprot:scaffold110707_cov36-Prasinocladus_malaysianus.AAC.1